MSKFSVLVQVRAYGVVCALVPTLPTFHCLKYNQTWSFFFKMRNKRKGEMQRGCEVHLLILCGHTHQHETSPWEHVGVWAYSSTACSLCSCTQPPHSLFQQHFVHNHRTVNCRNTDKPFRVGVKLGCVQTLPAGLVLWVGAFLWFEPAASCIWLLSKQGGSQIYSGLDGALMPFAWAWPEWVLTAFTGRK